MAQWGKRNSFITELCSSNIACGFTEQQVTTFQVKSKQAEFLIHNPIQSVKCRQIIMQVCLALTPSLELNIDAERQA
jgi:hypothetical protein